MFKSQKLTKEQALQKIKHYCGYQERCHKEVKDKLYGYGLFKSEVDEIIIELINEDYLNEERFAKLWAGGKFRINHWGRNKILYELKQKQVSAYCLKVALKEINESDYLLRLRKLAVEKWASLKGEAKQSKKAKVYAYLSQKGYEGELILKALHELEATR